MNRLVVACVVLVAASRPAPAQDKVQLELGALADEVARVLGKQDQTAIAIGPFVGKGKIPSNFGPEIQRVLIAEFGKRKIGVNRDALIMISGSYFPATEDPGNPTSKEMFVRINAALENTKTGLPLPNVNVTSRAVYGTEELGRAFSVPVSLPPDANRDVRNDAYKDAYKAPDTAVSGATIKARPDSPFAVEVLVVSDPTAPDPTAGRPATRTDGLAFVDIKKTEHYRLRIHNTAPFDVAVRVSVDGIDQFAFSDAPFREPDGRPKFQYLIIPKGKVGVVKGWFRSLKSADSFLVTDYAKSASAELKANPAEVGVICVQFHAAWATDAEKPKDETSRDAATGRGKPVDTNLKLVSRTIGVFREQVAVRYAKPQP